MCGPDFPLAFLTWFSSTSLLQKTASADLRIWFLHSIRSPHQIKCTRESFLLWCLQRSHLHHALLPRCQKAVKATSFQIPLGELSNFHVRKELGRTPFLSNNIPKRKYAKNSVTAHRGKYMPIDRKETLSVIVSIDHSRAYKLLLVVCTMRLTNFVQPMFLHNWLCLLKMEDGPKGDVLCHYCRDLLESNIKIGFSAWWRTDEEQKESKYKPGRMPHHPSFRSFSDSARAGCHMCSAFVAQLISETRHEMLKCDGGGRARILYDDRDPVDPIKKNIPKYEIRVAYPVPPYLREELYPKYELRLRPLSEEFYPKYELKLQISETSGNIQLIFPYWCGLMYLDPVCDLCHSDDQASDRLLVVRDWLLKCLHAHSRCSQSQVSTHKRPARLIYVGCQEDHSDVQLCSTVRHQERYMTLSHCWGLQDKPPKLLKENLSEYSTKLPWNSLPPTFKDAIM